VGEPVGVPEQRTAGNEAVRPGCRRAGNGGRPDAPIHLDVDVEPGVEDHASYLGDLGLHGGDVVLPAEPGVDGHDEHHVDEVEHPAHCVDGGGRVEGDGGTGAGFTHLAERTVQVPHRLGVHDDQLATGIHERLVHPPRLVHHQVRLEGHAGVGAHGGHHVWSKREIRDEATVHDVELDAIDPRRLKRCALLTEPGVVRRQDRRDDLEASIGARQGVAHGGERSHRRCLRWRRLWCRARSGDRVQLQERAGGASGGRNSRRRLRTCPALVMTPRRRTR
jgi:hypothetical protein